MNMGYIENSYFHEIATDFYISAMACVLTGLVLIGLKEFRWEIQSIYFFYFSALNQDRAVNFLRLRTVWVEGVEQFGMDHGAVERAVNQVLLDNAVYGKLFKSLVIEDRVKSLEFERDLRTLKECRESFLDDRLPFYSKWLLPSEAKDAGLFEAKLRALQVVERSSPQPVTSGYAFCCFSNFEVVSKFKKYSRRSHPVTRALQ